MPEIPNMISRADRADIDESWIKRLLKILGCRNRRFHRVGQVDGSFHREEIMFRKLLCLIIFTRFLRDFVRIKFLGVTHDRTYSNLLEEAAV